MIDFDYKVAGTVEDAVRQRQEPGSAFIAGGTNLIDLMKGGVASPTVLIDITRLPLATLTPLADGGLRIGSMVRNSTLAANPIIVERYPLLAQALLSGASPQLRNMATVGGNLLQRTRCYYFYDTAFASCNKRQPDSGCAALEGMNRIHAIVGASKACIATNPSDMNVALAALRASVVVHGRAGERRIAMGDFHRLPGDTPQLDTNLADGELITAVELPALPFSRHAHYLKVRDRASYAFSLVSVGAALDIRGGVIEDAALALGGIAPKPWRVVAAERMLIGHRLDADILSATADTVLEGAQVYPHNAFKVPLARHSIVRALQTAASAA